MADQAPPTNSEPNESATAGSAVPALPEKIRVHALAKLLGVTSKQVLAEAAALGTELRSAQSSLQRDVAERVHAAFTAAQNAPTEPPAAAEPAAETPAAEPVAETPAAEPVAETPAAEPAVEVAPEPVAAADVEEAAVEQTPAPAVPAEETPAQEPVAEEAAVSERDLGRDLFTTASYQVEAPAAEPAVETPPAVSQVPLFLQPDLAAVETPPRRRRSRRDAGTPEPTTEQPPVVESHDEVPETAKATDTGTAETETDESDVDGDQPRRRRRGRRGRGRGRGEQQNEQDTDTDTEGPEAEESARESAREEKVAETPARELEEKPKKESEEKPAEAEQAEAESGDEEAGEGDSDGSSRRRRRRRRRKSGGEGAGEATSEDDPPNTVVHEREPRNKSRSKDEVQGITGSTRLEAKRQRRRDGRDAGRRRPPILTESEFLARREAVDRVMVVRDRIATGQPHATTQVAVLEDGVLVEHFVTTSASASMVGNVYLGRVQNVLPSMEAAFIDIGRGRNGVLYAGEVNWEAAGLGGNSRKIEQALKPGDQVLVQVSKDPVGHKGARLTTQISLAGRFLVYVPGGTSTGISRKLPDTERKRLKDILRDIVPSDAGVIIRTASEGVSEEELARDVKRLQDQWAGIEAQAAKAESGKSGNPQALYEEPDLLVKVIRDLFNEDFSKLVIEGEKAWSTVESYIKSVAPDLMPRLEQHTSDNGVDVFVAHRIDEQLAKALDRKVWLPSGGTLVIDRTEAMTVVDVNTGKFTGAGGNLEETVTRNNLEAAEEIVRQMRLRDIGGMIVVDFIDMVLESNRDLVLRRLTEALGRDRTRHQVSEVTSLGLVQMTRKKLGTGLVEAFSTTCEHCHGRGILVHAEPIEVKASEDNGARGGSSRGGDSGGSRKKRGRDKSSGGETSQPPVHEETPTVDATVKRAHPVALAMAHHHHEEEAAHAHSGHEAESAAQPAAAVPEPEQPVAVEAETPAADLPGIEEAMAEAPAAVAAEAVVAPEAEEVVVEEAVVEEAVAEEPVVEPAPAEEAPVAETPEPVVEREPEPQPEPVAPPRRRSRRVSRAAAAPVSETPSAGTVFVIPTSETGAEHAPEPEPAMSASAVSGPPASSPDGADAQAAPRRPRRRRAAARPAGPPVDADN
ncbi:translation initiation factor IF-2 N-terminal domain-containing protein [Rhodococcus opacus]|uniref:translation initiation factor IF-2 N-terminal domain-containing protein n=2 Tax=Rhodococcus opacus TaxID=37919 RepID=UPI0015F91438|nr:translation initiation factor IF-2 N-terminal domain-containing protein [Rhodococcus opacus]MBA8963978.1 ribonuclease E [Rhodococcus opacus]MBP2208060.1 ribonuclease E [Rhodococcus opacus]MDV6244046.1 translation initiation factor IF-2 N-terminal domain-containing protein [Rhodococcus opacus]UNN00631.1 translation initiation factor IF-2 N-terminal domain-containing protein [Rhodococcus opacus]UZG53552.1 translation initiation factor IF-2 N-terminal domain-containing protein [Rhodococcus opa